MRYALLLFIFLSVTLHALSQEVPYASVPEQPSEFTAPTVVARMIDGLGFRFYWATEGLTDKDYNFKAGDDARSIAQTVEHIYGLTNMIKYASLKKAADGGINSEMTIFEIRNDVLKELKNAADIFRNATPEEMNEFNIISKRGGKESITSFWNVINGPIEDAVWHAGQIVTIRRMAGNPINPKVNFFTGKLNN